MYEKGTWHVPFFSLALSQRLYRRPTASCDLKLPAARSYGVRLQTQQLCAVFPAAVRAAFEIPRHPPDSRHALLTPVRHGDARAWQGSFAHLLDEVMTVKRARDTRDTAGALSRPAQHLHTAVA